MAKKRKQMSASEDDDETETSGECEHRRGRSTIAVVGKAIRRGAKLPLEWNHNKVPIGTNKEVFASYIGVVVRERVSINYREWEDVPKQVINEVYEFITKGFEVPEERRSYVLTRASIRWRTFKARLIKYWMYDTKGENKNVIIRNPPSMYPWILQSHWNEFIATYTDPKFKELSDLNRERAKKKSSSYRGGRKGYVYYEEQIAEELRSQKIEVKDVPRHLVWIRAHPRQENNEMYFDNPADFEVAQAIKALEVQQRKGEIDVVGRNDILARALKTPEHGGCVRGVGSGVTNKQYFGYNKPTPPSQVQSELRNVKTQLAHLENTQNLLMSYILSGEFNPEHLKQICSSNIDQVNNKEFGSIQRIESIGVETDHYDNVAQQGLQGVEFRLSNRLKGIKKGKRKRVQLRYIVFLGLRQQM
ncbi:hypothetical protein RND81_04G179000 [Saponaria officinalis]|uniref:Transposase n=1 Tax=Saponaria officinalis TaxID=3572 RepID=A0AAW1LFL8_SAPOF